MNRLGHETLPSPVHHKREVKGLCVCTSQLEILKRDTATPGHSLNEERLKCAFFIGPLHDSVVTEDNEVVHHAMLVP